MASAMFSLLEQLDFVTTSARIWRAFADNLSAMLWHALVLNVYIVCLGLVDIILWLFIVCLLDCM